MPWGTSVGICPKIYLDSKLDIVSAIRTDNSGLVIFPLANAKTLMPSVWLFLMNCL